MPGAKLDCSGVPHLISCQQRREGRAGEGVCPSLQPSSWKFEGLAVGDRCSSGGLDAGGGRTGQRTERVLTASVTEPLKGGGKGPLQVQGLRGERDSERHCQGVQLVPSARVWRRRYCVTNSAIFWEERER